MQSSVTAVGHDAVQGYSPLVHRFGSSDRKKAFEWLLNHAHLRGHTNIRIGEVGCRRFQRHRVRCVYLAMSRVSGSIMSRLADLAAWIATSCRASPAEADRTWQELRLKASRLYKFQIEDGTVGVCNLFRRVGLRNAV
jgi:hypothetical protein